VSCCGFPTPLTSKSSAIRSLTGCPCRSSTVTSRRTAADVLRTGCGAGWGVNLQRAPTTTIARLGLGDPRVIVPRFRHAVNLVSSELVSSE
jgi:hypothetical protein